MKKIEALINPSKLEAVTQGLSRFGIRDISTVEIKRCSGNGGRALVFRGTEFTDNFPPMTKFEIVVADELAKSAIGVIQESATSTKGVDGRIIVSNVEQCFDIRAEGREEKSAALLIPFPPGAGHTFTNIIVTDVNPRDSPARHGL